ncbi:MAG: ribonuclease H-like domain-containing protein [Acidobacteria bacterium]|nr:ribonuclease H-like domain-containing protein [Acidobacteriota bacterium]
MSAWLNDRLGRIAALRPARRALAAEVAERAQQLGDADALARVVGGEVRRNEYGEHVAVRRWYAEPESFMPHAAALRLLAPESAEALRDPQQWLFLDTETTGLAGGTGTYAFLVGVAWWDAGGLQVEQLFMRDFGEEHSLLLALAERLRERPVLVTFNGKTFDWPLLETRYRMTRAIPVESLRAHLDLLHPARQLWRMRLQSVRLTELEKHVLGWDRGPDMWSAMIPQLYFDYLRGGAAEPLADVFRHNQHDLRGLAALSGKMLSLLAVPEAADCEALDLFGISRLLRRRGEMKRSRYLYERALASGLPGELDRAARRELARLAKREKDFGRATQLWEGMVGAQHAAPLREEDGADAELEAYEQLAMYYEHQARQPERAAVLTREALASLGDALQAGNLTAAAHRKLHARLEHRLERLARRAGQNGRALFAEAASPTDPAESNPLRKRARRHAASKA